MNHIHLFESFIEQLYEIRLTDPHYQERTTNTNSRSRVAPRSEEYPAGWRVTKFLTSKNEEISDIEFEKITELTQKEMDDYISIALQEVTFNIRLKDWQSPGSPLVDVLYLGRIAFYNGDEKYYPYLSGGHDPHGKPGSHEYDAGDAIWANANGDLAKTIKYYPGTKQGVGKMWNAARLVAGLGKSDMNDVGGISYPYGRDFEVIIDLTDTDKEGIISKIKDQVRGRDITLGSKERENIKLQDPDYLSPDSKRIGLVKGVIIGIEDSDTKKVQLFEITDDPINGKKLYSAWEEDKSNGTKKLKESSVSCEGKVMNEITTYIGSNPIVKYMAKTSFTEYFVIDPGNIVYIKRIPRGEQMDPKQPYIFKWITSEPSILKKGKVQIALDIA